MSALVWARRHKNLSGSLVYRQRNRWLCGQSSPQSDGSSTARELKQKGMARYGSDTMEMTWVGTDVLVRPISTLLWARRHQNWSGSLVFKQRNRCFCSQSTPQSDESSVKKQTQNKIYTRCGGQWQ